MKKKKKLMVENHVCGCVLTEISKFFFFLATYAQDKIHGIEKIVSMFGCEAQ